MALRRDLGDVTAAAMEAVEAEAGVAAAGCAGVAAALAVSAMMSREYQYTRWWSVCKFRQSGVAVSRAGHQAREGGAVRRASTGRRALPLGRRAERGGCMWDEYVKRPAM